MTEQRDEFPEKALLASLIVGLMTLAIAVPVLYFRAARIYRQENNIAPVQRRGFFGNYFEEQSVALADLGFSAVLWQIVIPAACFFVLYVLIARIVQSFCEVAEAIFRFAEQNNEELIPKGYDFLVVRVVFWPFFLIYGVLLILGALTIFLFRGIWR